MDALNRWAINESLLQSYRSIFISSQSFLLAVGAIMVGQTAALVYLTAIIGLVVTWFIWVPVVSARHKIVDYYKHAAKLDPEFLTTLCSEEQYMSSEMRYREANTILGVTTHWRKTRKKVDGCLPVLFSAIWVALMLHQYCGI